MHAILRLGNTNEPRDVLTNSSKAILQVVLKHLALNRFSSFNELSECGRHFHSWIRKTVVQ